MKPNRVIASSVSGTRYRIGDVLGEGGFGRAYRAYELGRHGQPIEEVCLKTTTNQACWHRESYFGELFRHSRRVIQLYDSFPLVSGVAGRTTMIYCLVMELAKGGTIADYFSRPDGEPWPAARATREIMALLKLLDQLHGGGATHRDITPTNIFVCGRGVLKLGDFGIARHQVGSKLMTVDAFNPAFVTRGFLEQSHRQWRAADDVFQMGQLLAMLLRGDADNSVTTGMVQQLDCEPSLKALIKKAIGPRSKRYADAYEMLLALEGDHEAPTSPATTLHGKTVAFAGRLSIKRFDAEIMVLQAGGEVAQNISRKVDILVQGGGRRKDGHKSVKLRQVQKLIEQGHDIHIISEREFRKLVRKDLGRS